MAAKNPATVFVVNDDPKMLALFVDMLGDEGYKIVSAGSGSRALELARLIRIDTVICDVVMPEMDGMEVSRRLKQDALTANIPVLLVSALRSQGRSRAAGARIGGR